MIEGGRNGDVSGPITPYDRGDLGGLHGAVEPARNLHRNT
ncbi:UNVERIFIED_CONTAM: hypothetical protein RKD50_009597 [Streptomyces canus]